MNRQTDAIGLGASHACLTGDCHHSSYEKCHISIIEHINDMQADAQSLAIDRCNWKAACEYIMTVISEGGAKGRPMDLISDRAWQAIRRHIVIANEGLGPDYLERDE